uniref:PH domain-containing protein n=1 Tax=Globisporangium ultimum (strain ATCC 200006 / CBS 805.95 / DAOM BR144) TaxID=431595 RepID=K3XA17_GLOUD
MWAPRKCTCAVETESDSDADSDSDQPQVPLGDQEEPISPAFARSDAAAATGASISASASGQPPVLASMSTSTPPFNGRLPRNTSGVRDPIQTSHALHNSEALRQAQTLQNVFCACYETETVLSLVQKRERAMSPMQMMLLETENIAQVFMYATTFPEKSSHHKASHNRLPIMLEQKMPAPNDHISDPEKYRRPYIATEIILRFYLKALTWHGSPKALSFAAPATVMENQRSEEQPVGDASHSPQTGSPNSQSPNKKSPSLPLPPKPFLLSFSTGFRPSAFSTRSFRRGSSSSFSDVSEPSAAVRGYILHLEDLTGTEWKRIFSGLYQFMWSKSSSEKEIAVNASMSKAGTADSDTEVEIDSVLFANMCRITKNFVTYPAVHEILSTIEVQGKETLFARFANYAYNPEVSTLLHGLLHLAQRRSYGFQPIIKSLVERIIEKPIDSGYMPSSPSSARSQFNLRSPLTHARISGCADVLAKVLSQEFPNTFSYYIQTKLQLASYESVEAFEREIFPPKILPNDRVLHEQIKNGVMSAILERPNILIRLAEVAIAEIRYLDANHADGAGIPPTLVIDVLRFGIENSLSDKDRLKLFVPPVQLLAENLCAAINYHQHFSTISEFASRDCFSDSDSEDSMDEDEDTNGDDSKSDELQNQSVLLSQLTKCDLSTSLIDIFEKFPKANILHCRIVKLYLNLFDRVSSNGRVNNPLLRSVFRPPDSLLAFIMHKLHKSSATHPYDAHLAIIGVKIDKICSSPRLEQELIRQYCHKVAGWAEFSSSLVSSHYQQIDALDDSVLGLSSLNGSGLNNANGRRGSDGVDDVFPLARRTSSATGFLSQELEPFRRLPMEKEGFGSPQNLATGNEIINPTDMFRSRTQSQYPQSIIDVLKGDTGTSFDLVEDEDSISGYVYQKRSKWVKVHLKFEKSSCLLILEDVPVPARSSAGSSSSPVKGKSTTKLKDYLMAKTQHWTSRRKKYVVCNSRKWIAFGRSVKNPGTGAFGFQVEAFDRSREVDKTLTFVTRTDATRNMWYEGMQQAMTDSQAMRNSITEADDEENIMLVKCVATKREREGMTYYVVPNVHLLGPVVSPNFFIKSEVPEELPFWGAFHGEHGMNQYVSLLNRCLQVISVDEKRMYASGYSVIVEFDARFQRVESGENESKRPVPSDAAAAAVPEGTNTVTCSCTDTYLITGNQIIGLTRTIADSEKLLKLLGDDE